jgi:hypothetical protein
LESYTSGVKIAIVEISIGLFVGFLTQILHLQFFHTVVIMTIIVISAVFVWFLPDISQKIGLRWPLFRKGVTSRTDNQVKEESMNMIVQTKQSMVVVRSQETLPRWEEIFNKTTAEVWFLGITLETVHQKTSQIENLLNTRKVKILLLKSDSDLVSRYEKLVETNDITNTINRTVTRLAIMRDQLSANQRRNLEIRRHDEIAAYSSVIIDPNSDEGSIKSSHIHLALQEAKEEISLFIIRLRRHYSRHS